MFQLDRQGAVYVISGDEAVGREAIPRLTELLESCLLNGQANVVLDLESAPLFDSGGLEWLLEASERCAALGGQLEIAGANPLCLDILRVTGVGESFEVHADARSAMRSFQR